MVSVDESNNAETIDLSLGDSVRVTLAENASIGYRWALDHHDERILDMLPAEPRYAPGASGGTGSAGEIAFVFNARQPGIGEIALKHWRHWEGESSVVARFRLTVRVTS